MAGGQKARSLGRARSMKVGKNNFMAGTTVSQLILSIKALSSSGLAPLEIFESSQFSDLLGAIDQAIDDRAKVVSALRKRKLDEREDDGEYELEMRKKKALKKVDDFEEYESYRQQQWVQYFDWAAQQQQQSVEEPAAAPAAESAAAMADEDIDAQLLGL